MKNVIEELWYGNLCPSSECYEMTDDRKQLLTYTASHYDHLKEILTKEQWEIFEKFDDCHLELSTNNERDIFLYAFRLGAKFMHEVLTGSAI